MTQTNPMTGVLNRRHFIGSAAIIGGATALPAFARTKMRDVSTTWPTIQAYIDASVAKKYVPGTAAAIARGVDQAAFMVSGRLSQDPASAAITPDTLWRAYSMTKPITGMAAMMLIEDGKMTLDQNIADFIPAFANMRVLTDGTKSLDSRPSQAPITIRTLLTHTAGLGYSIITKGPLLDAYLKNQIVPGAISRSPLPGVPNIKNLPSLAEFADRVATLPLIADPGVRWSYSISLDLLGRVIEVVSGMSFEDFLIKRMFGPLGMTSTFWQVPGSETYRLTTNHVAFNGATIPVDPGASSVFSDKPAFPYGGAGLVTSMRDYDRFQLMLMGEGAIGDTRIMSRSTARNGMSNLLHPDTKMESWVAGQGFGAGGGVAVTTGANGEGIGTYGWGGAASTMGWVDRARNVRASGWAQIMTQGEQPFTVGFRKAAYAALV
jgi:CubicO group peptidase (beta-lactamase class C family)